MDPLHRWWLRRRHGGGPWAGLLQRPPDDEWVSLDLETTGLDPARDHILSLAAVLAGDEGEDIAQGLQVDVEGEGRDEGQDH